MNLIIQYFNIITPVIPLFLVVNTVSIILNIVVGAYRGGY